MPNMMQVFCKSRGALMSAAASLLLLNAACTDVSEKKKNEIAVSEPAIHKVEIKQFLFNPDKLTIKTGDSVEWTNKDFVPHTATEESYTWDTVQLNKNESKTIVFKEAGEYEYICAYHPEMRGVLIVESN